MQAKEGQCSTRRMLPGVPTIFQVNLPSIRDAEARHYPSVLVSEVSVRVVHDNQVIRTASFALRWTREPARQVALACYG